jgi:hypothetical protein
MRCRMGRLVDIEDVKALISGLDSLPWEEELDDLVKTIPTAYDVEKVVEQLADNSRFIDDINEHNIKCISCVIGQKTAIDIVKRGGVK